MQLGIAPLPEQRPIFHSRNVEELVHSYARKATASTSQGGRPATSMRASTAFTCRASTWVTCNTAAHRSSCRRAPARTLGSTCRFAGNLEPRLAVTTSFANRPSPQSSRRCARVVGWNRRPIVAASNCLDQIQPYRPACRPTRRTTNRSPRLCAHHRPRRRVRPQPGTLRADGRRRPGTVGIGALEPTRMSTFEQFIIPALLVSHPHNYSAALRRLEKPIAPRDVRRDRLHRGPSRPGGHSGRPRYGDRRCRPNTLKHFSDFKGVSPMHYLRNARLRQVREALLRADPEANVTEIAMSTGFTHMGRFSVTYRRYFGESLRRR